MNVELGQTHGARVAIHESEIASARMPGNWPRVLIVINIRARRDHFEGIGPRGDEVVGSTEVAHHDAGHRSFERGKPGWRGGSFVGKIDKSKLVETIRVG